MRNSTKAIVLLTLAVMTVAPLAIVQVAPWRSLLRGLLPEEPPRASLLAPALWVAAAPGRVEPRSGEIRIGTLTVGRIAEVLVRPHDKVAARDLLIRLDDEEASTRFAAAQAEVALRTAERESQPAGARDPAQREAEDRLFEAERQLALARAEFDKVIAARRAERVADDDVANARAGLAAAEDQVAHERNALGAIKAATPSASSREEAALALARANLAIAEAVFEKTRIRAAAAGSVLRVLAKPGETVVPGAHEPLVVLGDLVGLRVRAEVDARDAGRVKRGQRVMIRADAFPASELDARVSSLAPSLFPARIAARERRSNDALVLDVIIDLDGPTALMPGMRVDVHFAADKPAEVSTTP